MSVSADKKRDTELPSKTWEVPNYLHFEQHIATPTTYVESMSVSKSSYSKPKEIDSKSYPSLIPPV